MRNLTSALVLICLWACTGQSKPEPDQADADASADRQTELPALEPEVQIPDAVRQDLNPEATIDLARPQDLAPPDSHADAFCEVEVDAIDQSDGAVIDLYQETLAETVQPDLESPDSCPYPGGLCNGSVYLWCPEGSKWVQTQSCLPPDGCHTGKCVPGTGCVLEALTDVPCEDGDLCTVEDECHSGICMAGEIMQCKDDNPCTKDDCDTESGCTFEPLDGPSCDDGNLCTLDDKCNEGTCKGKTVPCDDGNPCTQDSCHPQAGCLTTPLDTPCSDGDPCTQADWCSGGQCAGQPVQCEEGYECISGLCKCAAPCAGQPCGTDMCGNVCGVCNEWEECLTSQCEQTYPAPPWGPFAGDIIPNQTFIDPVDMSPVKLGQFWNDGKLVLLTFSAGWCIVCKQDTVLFNAWHNAYYDAGLRIVEVLYENAASKPPDQAYGLFWKNAFNIQYNFWLDTATPTGVNGKAEGGNLPFFRQPNGPLKNGSFPGTILICPQTMEILYISVGFYDEDVGPLVMQYLAGGCE